MKKRGCPQAAPSRLSKNLILFAVTAKMRGGARGGNARLEWNQIPRKALHRKACGEQREDFCAAQQRENQVLFQAVKEARRDFFDSLKGLPAGSPFRSWEIQFFPKKASAMAPGPAWVPMALPMVWTGRVSVLPS